MIDDNYDSPPAALDGEGRLQALEAIAEEISQWADPASDFASPPPRDLLRNWSARIKALSVPAAPPPSADSTPAEVAASTWRAAALLVTDPIIRAEFEGRARACDKMASEPTPPAAPPPQDKMAAVVTALLACYADELTPGACDACEQCNKLVMCNFHSVLSVLRGGTGIQDADGRCLSVPAAPPPQAVTAEDYEKVVAFHREMALRFSESRDALKHENRALKNEIAALKSVAPPPQEQPK